MDFQEARIDTLEKENEKLKEKLDIAIEALEDMYDELDDDSLQYKIYKALTKIKGE